MAIVLRARGAGPAVGPGAARGSSDQPDFFLASFAALRVRMMS